MKVNGLAPEVEIEHSEGENDELTVNTLAGTDTVDAGSLAAGAIRLTIDGGADSDSLSGSRGGDTLLGGRRSTSSPETPATTMSSEGPGTTPPSSVAAKTTSPGTRVTAATRSRAGEGSTRSSSTAPERARASTRRRTAGEFASSATSATSSWISTTRAHRPADARWADQTIVNDLSGTDVQDVDVDLANAIGGGAGDGAADTVTVNATNRVDRIDVDAVDGETVVTGLAATTRIAHAEPHLDKLVVNTLAGVDPVDVGPVCRP